MEDIIDILNELLDDVNLSKKTLNKVDKTRSKANKAISRAEAEIELLRSDSAAQSSANSVQELVLSEAPNIFTREVQKAISKNSEFSHPAFSTPLLDLADDPDLFSITIRGTGWSRRAIVHIAMDGVAGTIGEYARAVQDTREYLNVGKGDPTKSSELWKKYYKQRGRIYDNTINTRMQFADSAAPFWSLLNYGNKVSMSSDRGGSAYPNMPGTRFVESTQDAIESKFDEAFLSLKENNRLEINALTGRVSTIKKLMSQLDEAINNLINNIDSSEIGSSKIDDVSRRADTESDKLIEETKPKKRVIDRVKSIAKAVGSTLSRLFGLEE